MRPGQAGNFTPRVIGRPGVLVGAQHGQRVEHIGDGSNTCQERDRLAGQSVRVTCAILFFVMMQGDIMRRLQQKRIVPVEDAGTDGGVFFYGGEFFRCELAGLE